MTSKERLQTAIDLGEPDHVPLWCLWSHERDPFNRRDDLARVDAVLDLGMDDTLWLNAPWWACRRTTWNNYDSPNALPHATPICWGRKTFGRP